MVFTRESRKRVAETQLHRLPQEGNEEATAAALENRTPTVLLAPSNDVLVASSTTQSFSVVPNGVMADRDGFLSLPPLPSKSRRKVRTKPLHKQVKMPIEKLPLPLLGNIMIFLDSSRDLFHLTNTVKVFRQAIVPRPDIVVRAGVFSGGETKASMEDIMRYVRAGSVHIPSTLRLLRLVNGTHCERGQQCFNYNLKTQKTEKLHTLAKERPFALCLCKTCLNSDLAQTAKTSTTFDEQGYWNHPALAKRYGTHKMLRVVPFVEKATGDVVGSLIPVVKVSQLSFTYWQNCRPDTMTDEEAHVATLAAIEKLTKEARAKAMRREDAAIGGGSTEVSSTHSLARFSDNTSRVDEMVAAYDHARGTYEAFVKAKKALRRVKVFDRQQKKKHRARARNGAKVWKAIQEMMMESAGGTNKDDDAAMNDQAELGDATFTPAIPEAAATFLDQWEWCFECTFDEKGYCRFVIAIVDDTLGPICRAPSTATYEKMTSAICQLIPKLELLRDEGFLPKLWEDPYPFLGTDPCQAAIADYLKHEDTSLLARRCTGLSRHRRDFFGLLEEGKSKEALYHALTEGAQFNMSWLARSWLNATDIHGIFVLGVAMEYISMLSEEKFLDYVNVAEFVWRETDFRRQGDFTNYATFEVTYNRHRTKFRRLIGNIQAYLAWGETKQFLKETESPPGRPKYALTRHDAVAHVYKLGKCNRNVRTWLEDRNFPMLLNHHRDLFNNPLKFGLT